MSKLKKYFRQIFCIAGFLLLALVFAFNPVLSANAETSQTLSNAFAAVNLPITTVDLSDEDETNNKLVIPLLSTTITNYTIRVTDPSGRTHDLAVSSGATTADEYFSEVSTSSGLKTVSVENLTNGNYSITYIYRSGNKTYYSYPYAVKVKGINFELSFVEPETDAQGEENELAGKKILVPEVTYNGDEITLPDAYVKIVGTDNYETDSQGHKVLADFIVERDGAQIFSSKTPNSTITKIDGKWQLKTDLSENELNQGRTVTYRVIYKYPHGDTIPSKTFTIKVLPKDYEQYKREDAPKKLTVNATDLPSMELGQKGIVLPEWTASSENIANVDTNIVKIHIEKEGNSSIYCDLINNNRTFDFTKENFHADNYKDMVGNYTITYELESVYEDAEGKNITASLKKTILSVTDSSLPTVQMAYSYEIVDGQWANTTQDDTVSQVLQSVEGKTAHVQTKEDKDGNTVPDVNTDYAVELKANYGFGELVFPAIYAEDLVNTYGEFEFYRYFVNVNDFNDKFYIDNIKLDPETDTFKVVKPGERGYNASGDENIGQFNRIVRFKFDTTSTNKVDYFTGKTYALHYYVRVKDSANFLSSAQENNVYETGRTNYKFQVLNRPAVGKNGQGAESVEGVSKELSIKIKDLVNNSSINKNDKLSIKVESKDELDKRLKNAVFYYTGDAKTTVKTDFEDVLNALLLNETWGAYETDGSLGTDSLTKTDYFKNLKSNVLYNDDATYGVVKQMTGKSYTGFARLDEVDNENFETQLNLSNVEKINIVAVTINDNNEIAVATKTLRVNKTDETNAPVAGEVNGHESLQDSYVQGETVVLPSITFKDGEDSSLNVSAKYYVLTAEDDALIDEENPFPVVNYKSLTHTQFSQSGDTITISNAQLVTSKVGTYYVIFTATDDAGNQTVLNYSFAVVDSSEPVLTVTPKGEFDSISGTSIKAETNSIITFEPTVMKGSEDLTDTSVITISAVGKSHYFTATPAGSDFALLFEDEDEYTVTITLKNGEEVVDQLVYYVTISEPEKPLTWDFDDVEDTITAGFNEEVELPNLTATFGKSKYPVTITVKLSEENGNVPETGDVERNAEGRWVFKTGDQPTTYTATYTAEVNANGKRYSLTKTIKVKVGDHVNPEISFANDVSTLEEDIVYTGNDIEYIVDLKRYGDNRSLVIKAFSNGKKLFEVDTGMSIWDKDGSGNPAEEIKYWDVNRVNIELKTTDGQFEEVNDSEYANAGAQHYNITKVGKYTLVITVTDSNTNTQTKEFNFNVVTKTEAKRTNDNVVGIVLIVISVLVLVGVILFFALTGKKSGGNKTRRTKKTETDTAKVESETAKDTDTDAKSGDVE